MMTGNRTDIEIGSVAGGVIQEIARELVRERKGAALIIDYGSNGPSSDSLRGIKDHKFCHPLMEPGQVDLSVDVDFSYLARAVNERFKDGIYVTGPVTQEEFLKNMGIEYRVANLIRSLVFDHEKLKVFQDFKRLTNEMGTCYKVMALSTHDGPSAGFEKLQNEEKK